MHPWSSFICRRPYGIEKEFFVQLFLEPDESLKLPPTVGQLLNKMFKEQNISFSEVTVDQHASIATVIVILTHVTVVLPTMLGSQ